MTKLLYIRQSTFEKPKKTEDSKIKVINTEMKFIFLYESDHSSNNLQFSV